jgi:serine protease Do
VRNAEQPSELVSNSGKHVALLVQRENARIFIPVDLG